MRFFLDFFHRFNFLALRAREPTLSLPRASSCCTDRMTVANCARSVRMSVLPVEAIIASYQNEERGIPLFGFGSERDPALCRAQEGVWAGRRSQARRLALTYSPRASRSARCTVARCKSPRRHPPMAEDSANVCASVCARRFSPESSAAARRTRAAATAKSGARAAVTSRCWSANAASAKRTSTAGGESAISSE